MLTFGTGGIRAVMGDEPGEINRASIANVTHALASVILESVEPKSCVVAYDTRYHSKEFAELTAGILSAYGIETYRFGVPVPTPTLSFVIRKKKLGWGVVITASHNTKEYNGYKVYDKNGVQAAPSLTGQISERIRMSPSIENTAKFSTLGMDILKEHMKSCENLVPKIGQDIPIVYSPLYGTGGALIPELLKRIGFSKVTEVQNTPCPEFGGLKTPNPEDDAVYAQAVVKAGETGAEIICATDPDCDRVGVMVRQNGVFIRLTGNQIAAVLLDTLMPMAKAGDVVITTSVSGYLCRELAEANGLEVRTTPPGFKYIGEAAENLKNENKRFLFAYEENCGYLAGDAVRDKDGVLATALICATASRLANDGKTMYDKWLELSDEYGYFVESIKNVPLSEGIPEREVIDDIGWVKRPEGTELLVRRSGTEPKLKIYFRAKGETFDLAHMLIQEIQNNVQEVLTKKNIGKM